MIFEKIGAAQVDKGVQCLKIQIEAKLYLVGLQDFEQVTQNKQVAGVFQITEKAVQQTATSEKAV